MAFLAETQWVGAYYEPQWQKNYTPDWEWIPIEIKGKIMFITKVSSFFFTTDSRS